MAVLSYQFSQAEIEQFERLAQLGFDQQDQTSDPIDPEMVFSHSQLGIDFTFFPEGWQNEDDVEPKHWQIEVHGKTLSGSACITTDKLLTTTEFHTLVDPEHWSVMVPALQSLQSLAHWHEVMPPLLQGEQQEQSKRAVEARDAKIEQAKQAALVVLKDGKEIVFEANLYQSGESVLSRLRYDAVTDTLIHSSVNGQHPFHIALSQVDIDSSFSELGNNHSAILLRQPFDQYFEQVLDGVPYTLEAAPHRPTLLLETQDGSLQPLKIELSPVPEGYGGSFVDAFEQQKWKIDHAAPIRCGNARLEGGYLVSQRTTEGKEIFLGVTASPLQVLKVAQSLDLPLRDVLTEPLPLVRIEHLPALRRDRDCYNERREQVSQVVPRSGQPLAEQQIDVAIAVLIQRDAALNVKEKTNQLQVLGQSPSAQTLKERGGMDEMKAYLLTVMDQAREGLAKAPPGKAQEGR